MMHLKLTAEFGQRINYLGGEGGEAAVGVEGDDVGEDAAEGESFGGFAEGVDEGVVPGGAVADVAKDGLELGVGFLESC